MKENEKKPELLIGSRLNFINDQEFLIVSRLGSFIDNTQYKITKISKYQNKHYYNGGKMGRKPKRDKEVKKSKAGQMKNGAGKAIS